MQKTLLDTFSLAFNASGLRGQARLHGVEEPAAAALGRSEVRPPAAVAQAPWSEAEWAVALRFDNPRATVLVLLLG